MAATRDRAHLIQSIPSVWATSKKLATAPPMSAPTAPSKMVHRIEMFSNRTLKHSGGVSVSREMTQDALLRDATEALIVTG